jgi:hypothetical protein
MRKTTRALTIAVAAGALSLFGAGGALTLAAGSATQLAPGHQADVAAASPDAYPPQDGDAPGPTHPLCEGGTPFLGTPVCPTQ